MGSVLGRNETAKGARQLTYLTILAVFDECFLKKRAFWYGIEELVKNLRAQRFFSSPELG